jgi:hypothetical protein
MFALRTQGTATTCHVKIITIRTLGLRLWIIASSADNEVVYLNSIGKGLLAETLELSVCGDLSFTQLESACS